MSFFVILQSLTGNFVSASSRQRYMTAACCQGLSKHQWIDVQGVSVLIAIDSNSATKPVLARYGSHVGIGIVRLDHPDDVARFAGLRHDGAAFPNHMTLVLHAFRQHGERCMQELIGDFCFVLVDTTTRTVVAARDPFGVKTLYTTDDSEVVAFASRAELLAHSDHYNTEYIAEFLSGARPGRSSTIYAGVRPVAPGTIVSITDRVRSARTYWTPATFTMARNDVREEELEGKVVAFRDLFARAVGLRMTGGLDTWSELSGGLDSSSVVSMAQTLAHEGRVASGLGGTVTVVDTAGTGADEREFSNAVVRAYGVANEQVSDFWMLQDDGEPPPSTDQPTRRLLFYARDRVICNRVRRAGGSVLLGGQASDQYLTGYIFFIADWLATGRVTKALRELARWSVIGEVSFWELAFKNAIMPFLPPWLNARVSTDASIPSWLAPRLVKQFDLGRRQVVVRAYGGPIGHKYAAAMVRSVGDIPCGLDRGIVDDSLEFRYPFLYRPLVEFALRLPPQLCAVPTESKWILRRAMTGILPESVRRRRGKGAIEARLAWSMTHERKRLDFLFRHSILAELGCIDVQLLRSAIENATHSRFGVREGLVDTLALETWLAVRSGRQTVANPRLATAG